ncbi:MAG: thioredoxin [Candidatus Diapherotrites archaeon]|nr:thioredoxin [Candidatus Diapherotrites archaeon]
MTEITVNDSNFEENVIKKSFKTPVVVDFGALWCGPCRMLGPVLENLAKEYDGKFILAKANVDENPNSSQQYKVIGIPAVKMFKNGGIVDEFTGALPENSVKQWLDKNLG